MVGNNGSTNDGSSSTSKNSRKFTRFPRLAVREVVQFSKAIVDADYDLKKDRLCMNLGKSPTSSSTDAALAAARSYGLIKDMDGSFITVTELGRKICSQDDYEKQAAYAEANSNVDHFRNFLDQLSEKRVPDPATAGDQLEHSLALTAKEAQVFYNVVMQNARDAGLIETLPAGEIIRSVPLTSVNDGGSVEAVSVDAPVIATGPSPLISLPENGGVVSNAGSSNATAIEMHFNIQIHLPESNNPEVYDAIFRSIKENLLSK